MDVDEALRLQRQPGLVRDDSDVRRQAHDVANAADRFRFRGVEAGHARADPRRWNDGREAHPRHARVEAESGAAGDEIVIAEFARGRADQAEEMGQGVRTIIGSEVPSEPMRGQAFGRNETEGFFDFAAGSSTASIRPAAPPAAMRMKSRRVLLTALIVYRAQLGRRRRCRQISATARGA